MAGSVNRTVKAYLETQAARADISGTAWANQGGALVAYRQMPKTEKLGSNLVVVVSRVKIAGTRLTAPRGAVAGFVTNGAQRVRIYTAEVLIYGESADEQQGGDDFDQVVDGVVNAFESASVPFAAADPSTPGFTTQILSLGERWEVEIYEPVTRNPGAQGLVRFFATVTPTVEVITQG